MIAAAARRFLAATAAASLLAAGPAGAATYNVSSVAGLTNAVAAANATLGPDVIVMAPGVYALDGTNAGFPVTDDLTVLGGGRPGTVIIGFYSGLSVFDVHADFGTGNPLNQQIHATFVNLAIQHQGITFSTGLNGRLIVEGCSISGSGHQAIYASGGPAYVFNSSLSGMNRGVYLEGDSLTLDHDTISGNSSAGLESYGGPVTVRNTLFAYNGTDVASVPNAADHNLDTDGSGGAGFITADPLLGAPADNGGPTPTYALASGSPAIDAGLGGEPIDARGVSRPQGAAPDIGAFEWTALPFSTVSATLPPGGSVTTDTAATGATATTPVQTALNAPGGGTITIDQGPGAADFGFLGQTVQITASPDATPASPFVITFTLDASVIPAGQSAATIEVDKNTVAVPNCTGAPGTASPDPCVSARTTLAGGDVQITVLSSSASRWQFAPGATSGVAAAVRALAFAVEGANPCPGTPTFRFELPKPAHVTVALYDVSGRRVATLADGAFGAGVFRARWSPASAPGVARAGVYFARMVADDRVIARRVVVLGP